MLFNTYAFIFLFLPLSLVGFFQLAKLSHAWAAGWLAAASLLFYGWWNPVYVGLLMASILGNYSFGWWIAKAQDQRRRHRLLTLAIVLDLLLLAYFKYANFFLQSLGEVAGTHLGLQEIVLPLGISFFTFTQIAFLVDTYQGKVKEFNFVHYTLFVTYFPHLIAGPVLHHKEMMPQFSHAATYRFSYKNLAVGLSIFTIGLFKKVLLADNIAFYVPLAFDAPAAGVQLTFVEAWGGALCYALQLYFDFSGYSDMAIGISRMFGVVLPLNFHSPYKAVNIIEFWRRWHMTLSRFLRDYLYFPLGGNRKGKARRYVNLAATMLLGGLWHGAGWNFVIWGGLHGIYLSINHGWHALRRTFGQDPAVALSRPMHLLSGLITFLAVTIAWVFFRASDLHTAVAILESMLGFHGITIPDNWFTHIPALYAWLDARHAFAPGNGLATGGMINWIWILLLIVWLGPNTQTIMQNFRPALDAPHLAARTLLLWRPNFLAALFIWGLLFVALINLSQQSTFLYFQF
ncbi:MBOAT family O-acyltransferase [Ferriphaselus sp. R-1]|uniref:MBOAT family O-acyltransferase n=1 Tax=Ferriphaselus sp. R-1 TaxID=1485544 RepID=UPI0005505B31|nr:MBOAT family O-acyltransferase [Ferriphaselus sp. R-1]